MMNIFVQIVLKIHIKNLLTMNLKQNFHGICFLTSHGKEITLMNKKEKLLIVASFAGSIVKFRGNLMKLLSLNYDVCIACPTPNKKTLDFFKQHKITFYKLEIKNSKISPFSDLIYLAKLLFIVWNVSKNCIPLHNKACVLHRFY